jgi:iron complex outermembrane receptor protein
VVRASSSVAVGVLIVLLPCVANSQTLLTLPPIDVIAPSPLAGPGIDRDKIPGSVETLSAQDIARSYSVSITEALSQRVPGVNLTDVQGNGFVQDLRFRGFAASPLQGTPQGIAVYQNGMRINEAFGDTVNWDLIPTSAVDRVDIWTGNPVFGLNALGGAVSIQMKNGFTYQGREAELQGGSYGRLSGSAQYGGRMDNLGVYVAAEGLNDNGWRYQSPGTIKRFYGDVGWKGDRGELHVTAGAGSNKFGVVGPTPVELLDRDRKAVFTWPQTTSNQMQFMALNGKFDLFDAWSMQAGTYVRKFRQRHVDGNGGDIEDCPTAPGTLCLSSEGFPGLPPGSFQIRDTNNNPIAFAGAMVPYGTVDRTATDALTAGASLQFSNDVKLLGHDNSFTAGGSLDRSWVQFSANSELGFIFPDLGVGPNSSVPGIGSIISTAGNIGYSPVNLSSRSDYYGLFIRDTFDVTQRLSLTAGARLNIANIRMMDQLGTSPDLSGNHTFSRINPLAGVTFKLTPTLTTYAGYSEGNRAPTPLELGCSNPNRPCLLEGFLVSDPPLNQVVSRTYELGLRGHAPVGGGRLDWKFGLFRTDSTNDIINVASAIQGRGVFQNVDATRRQGIETNVQVKSGQWLAYASYSLIDATYQFTGNIASPNNPSADANGNISVVPEKRIPGIPLHQLKASIEYAATPDWKIGGNLTAVGSQYYVGDDGNQNPKLPAYWFVNLYTSYQLTKEIQLFALLNNVFDRHFSTYGTYFQVDSVANAISTPLTDPRTQTPAQPLSVYAGARIRW